MTMPPKFEPGMSETLEWVSSQNVLGLMLETDKPCMVYFYHPEQLRAAYGVEAGLLRDSRAVKSLKRNFFCIRINSTREEALGPEEWGVPGGKTGLLFLDHSGKPMGNPFCKQMSSSRFRKLLSAVGKENAKRVQQADAPEKPEAEADEPAPKKKPKRKAVSLMVRGKEAYQGKCGVEDCHGADDYPPQDYTRDQWKKMMSQMSKDHEGETVELTSGERTAILFYVMANSKK